MSCTHLAQQLEAYVDGELLADERSSIETHLAGCPACASRAEIKRQNRSAVRAAAQAATPLAPAALRARVLSGLHDDASRDARRRLIKLSAAAATVALVASLGHWQYRAHQRRLYSVDAVERHARQFPLEVRQPSPEQLEAWFGGKLDHRVALPRFPNAVAEGARLLNVREKQAAYVRYDSAPDSRNVTGHQLGLFVYGDSPGEVAVDTEPELANSHGYNVVSWREGDLVYQLVTDLDEQDVMLLLHGNGATPAPSNAMPMSAPRLEAQPASFQR